MAALRGRLRAFATTWLVFQVAWLAVLVPRDCCAAHRPAAASCHESAPVEATAAAGHHHATSAPSMPDDCRLTGACDGPMAGLLTLLSGHGILPSATAVPSHATVRPAWTPSLASVIPFFESPDSPPPRA